MIQRACTDAHEYFARRENWIRRVLVRQNLGTAVLMEADGFHRNWRVRDLVSW